MSDINTGKSTEMPAEAPHFFTEVAFHVLPEVNIQDIVYLSKVVKSKGDVGRYSALRDALRKIQWAKLAGLEAIKIEKELSGQMAPGTIAFDPISQARHAKAIMESVIHTKAALDSLAVFLSDLLSLPAKGGERDFRRQEFRNIVVSKDAKIGNALKSIEQWLRDLVERRDMWIHWSSPMIALVVGPSVVGVLPVPKKLEEYSKSRFPISKQYHWSTQEFVELNISKVSQFFSLIVKRCIEIELIDLSVSISPPETIKNANSISFFPMTTTKDMTINTIRFRDST